MNRDRMIQQMHLVREARKRGAAAITKFNEDLDWMMKRLIHEAARHRMSVEDVSRETGLSLKRIRTLMRQYGLNPYQGKQLLAANAAKALVSNADLMDIEPEQMDLLSPLAYLPMGEKMRKQLVEDRISRTTEDPDERAERLTEVFKQAWHQADQKGEVGSRTRAGIDAVLAAL